MTFERHNVRKRFGQHWLKDENILQKILEAADLRPKDTVLEVGPGQGALTANLLASKVSAVYVIELDRDLIPGLKKLFGKDPRFSIKEGDVLSLPLTFNGGVYANKVVANIPYNITGPLLERLIGRFDRSAENIYERLVLLVQKEVAERILAKPGKKSFSALSVRIQLMAKCSLVCYVPPKCFQPSPKVQSAVIAIDPFCEDKLLSPEMATLLDRLLKSAFSSRRKKLRNTIGQGQSLDNVERIAKNAEISFQQRPQEISPVQWVKIAKSFQALENED